MLHSTQPLHLSGPLHQPRNLLFRYVTEQIRDLQRLDSVVYLGEKARTNGRRPLKLGTTELAFRAPKSLPLPSGYVAQEPRMGRLSHGSAFLLSRW